jgi:hypothetical protein
VAEDDAEAEADGDDAALDAGAVVELEEELQPAAASPMKASPTATNRARVDRKVSMEPTLATATCVPQ